MDKFEKRQVPFTVATVDMDWHWSDSLDEQFKITQSGKMMHGMVELTDGPDTVGIIICSRIIRSF